MCRQFVIQAPSTVRDIEKSSHAMILGSCRKNLLLVVFVHVAYGEGAEGLRANECSSRNKLVYTCITAVDYTVESTILLQLDSIADTMPALASKSGPFFGRVVLLHRMNTACEFLGSPASYEVALPPDPCTTNVSLQTAPIVKDGGHWTTDRAGNERNKTPSQFSAVKDNNFARRKSLAGHHQHLLLRATRIRAYWFTRDAHRLHDRRFTGRISSWRRRLDCDEGERPGWKKRRSCVVRYVLDGPTLYVVFLFLGRKHMLGSHHLVHTVM